MKITEQQLERFQFLYKKHYGIELPKEEALQASLKLLTLYKDILLPSIDNLCTK